MVTEDNPVKHYRHKQITLWIICAVVILISGIAIGTGTTMLLIKHRIIWIGHPHKDAAAIAKKISEKYKLSQQQTTAVEAIFEEAFQRKQLQREEMRKKRDEEAQILIAEMKDILTPQQFERWDKDFQAMKDRYKNRSRNKK